MKYVVLENLLNKEDLKSEAALKTLAEKIQSKIPELTYELKPETEETGYFRLIMLSRIQGARYQTDLRKALLENPDMEESLKLSSFVKELGGQPFNLKTDDKLETQVYEVAPEAFKVADSPAQIPSC